VEKITIDDIHHNLMMTAFVDFMMYIVVHNRNQCQSKYTMESVYGVDTFSDFSTFLTQFSSSGPPSDSYHDKLVAVNEEISKIVTLCSSVKCPVDPDKLSKAHGSLLPSSARPPSHTTPASLEGPPSQPPGPHQRGCLIM
jgi:hypothetical protein